MNKQQLASKIWESVNKMRSKIEANEYNLNIPQYVDSSDSAETKSSLSALIDGLLGNDFDMKGLSEFQSLLRGKNHG
jgi:type I restriction-modification system DNA methylase subunit